jgi:hypothetical protein
MNRYINFRKIINNQESFSEIFENRNIKQLEQYILNNYKYPLPKEIDNLTLIPIEWKMGDKLHKVSDAFYGSPNYWYILALFNNTPTDYDISIGQTIYIPKPLELVIKYINK